jgi:ubiquinone/menaquinone biosynthesis C-methylase UbiE
MHATVLGLKHGMKIVDVGCGTGDFTRYLASLISGKCNIVGVDFRAANLRAAEKQTMRERLGGKISFRKGDVFNIPVEDGWADLTCCRTLLMHLADPLKAVQEMSRVTRIGGTVAAVERGSLSSVYVPDDERFSKMAVRLWEDFVEGLKKLEGKDFAIGDRLPTIFHKAGLREIMAEVQTDAYLSSDPRRRIEDVRAEIKFWLASFKETKKRDAKAMLAGGATREEVRRYNRWIEKWLQGLLKDDEKLRNDTTFNADNRYIVVGRKQDVGSKRF